MLWGTINKARVDRFSGLDRLGNKGGILYIVSTPIGNYKDITLRALDVLRCADFVISEEYKQGSTLLKKLGIGEKEIFSLNEHNEKDLTPEIIQLLTAGKQAALISDCGTPAFADPGTLLIEKCLKSGIPVRSVPGPSSLMAAISLSPLAMDEFYFAGFLPRKRQARQSKLRNLEKLRIPVILMDTPYRLEKSLQEIIDHFGKRKLVTLAVNLTKPDEGLFHGPVVDVLSQIKNRKAEFILILHP